MDYFGAVKTEFSKFGDLLEKAKKNIDTASETIEQLQGRRTKAINRKLRDIKPCLRIKQLHSYQT